MADGVAHAANLTIAPFADRNPQDAMPVTPSRIEQRHVCRTRPPAIQRNAGPQPIERVRIRHSNHLGHISPLDAVSRVCQSGRQRPVVREQQQAFRVVVEPTDRIDVLADAAEQIEYGRSPLRIRAGRDESARLVEQDVPQPFVYLDTPAVHPDVVDRRIGLRAHFLDGSAVDRDAAAGDQRLGGTPRSDAGLRQELLESNP